MVSTHTLTVRDILGPEGEIARRTSGYEHREPQIRLAEAVAMALAEHEHLVAEAGTGVGKSFAYIVPAVLSGKRVVISTAVKALQSQLMEKDLPFLADLFADLAPFTYTNLKGVGNYLCLAKLAEIEAGGVARSQATLTAWQDIQEWRDTTSTGDVEEAASPVTAEMRPDLTATADECTGKACLFAGQCFSRTAKQRAKEAQITVVNHALLMIDAQMRQRTGFAVLPDCDAIVIDEAHQLEEAAINAFAIEVTEARWQRIAARIKKFTGLADELLGAIGLQVRALFADYATKARGSDERGALRIGDDAARGERIRELILQMIGLVEQGAPSLVMDSDEQTKLGKAIDAALSYGDDLLACLTPDPSNTVVRYVETDGQRTALVRTPIDVSAQLREMLFSRQAKGKRVPVVSTSATIVDLGQRFDYWRSRVGMDAGRELLAGSPFDYHKNSVLYIPHGLEAPAYGDRLAESRYYDRMGDEMERLVRASGGRAFLLFTSRKALNAVHDRIGRRLATDFLTLKQGASPTGLLVRRFKDNGAAVLFGLKSFWEGVSVEGEALSLVAIDKMPFAPPGDPVWDGQCEAITRATGDKWAWFNRLALPTAAIALKQGFGRLIRTTTDTGVVAILDSRLRTKAYGKRVIAALPPARQCDEFACVEAFFAGQEVGQSRMF